MIERYSRPAIKAVWESKSKYEKWLQVELAVCEAWTAQGRIPEDAMVKIREKASFNEQRITEIEAVTRHDVLAFTTSVAEFVGEESRFIHLGLTSSDILDTTLGLQLKEATDILIGDVEQLIKVLRGKVSEYAYTPMIGRTHGVHAEPITFGLKLATWLYAQERNLARLYEAKSKVAIGKISGAVGTYANVNPRIEEDVCTILELAPAKISTQIVPRDIVAEYVATLASIAATLDLMALEIRGMQRTEVLEVEEPFRKGQKGSSAMPHKRNPIVCERVCGLSRLIRSNAQAAFENVALWQERDISHSSVERVILPDSTILLDYILDRMIFVIEGLQVYPDNMMRNLNHTKGLVFSQRLLLALVDKGCLREDAYLWVQRNAMQGWKDGDDFQLLVQKDKDITNILTKEEIDECFDYSYHLRHVDEVLARFDIIGKK